MLEWRRIGSSTFEARVGGDVVLLVESIVGGKFRVSLAIRGEEFPEIRYAASKVLETKSLAMSAAEDLVVFLRSEGWVIG